MTLPEQASELLADIQNKKSDIGVIGLGYVGLPLIDAFIQGGFHCTGFDVDPAKVESLKRGKSYIKHISDEKVGQWVDSNQLSVTADLTQLNAPQVLIICVPTPLTEAREPDLQYIEATCHSIAKVLRPGQLVILESTTYPTTTRDVMVPILESSGLKCGTEFFVSYSPEREDPGNASFSAAQIPKVVGGIDDASCQLACALYSQAVAGVIPVENCEVAEAAKVLENIYRAVNIALVNELKVLFDAMDIDVWNVIDAAKTKPFGFQAFYPGPGLGGHCIPIDPFYLSWLARKYEHPTRFIELAGEVNTSMPRYVIGRLAEFLNDCGKPIKGSKICLLGVAYKKDVDDPRESPSFVLMDLLLARGASLTYSDPHVPTLPSVRHHDLPSMDSQALTAEFLKSQDCVLIATDHTDFDYQFIVENAPLTIDTRNATKAVTGDCRANIRKT